MGRLIGFRVGRRVRWRVATAFFALLAGNPVAAQQGAYSATLGPASVPGYSNAGAGAGAGAGQPDIPFDTKQLLYRELSPPAGTPRDFQSQSGARVNSRLGALVAPELVAGTRLGGGTDSPSIEAITVDPRDAFDAKVSSLSDTRQR